MSEEKKPEQCPICGDDLMLDRQQLKALNDKLVDLSERTKQYAREHPECPISPTITSEAIGIKHSIGDVFNVVYVRKLGKWCLVPYSEQEREEKELLELSPLALPRQPRVWRPSRAMRAQEDDLA